MGMAAEPIGGVAAPLLVSLTDISLWEWRQSRVSDEWPVVAGIVR